jgi:hypothetical protein
MTSAGTTGVPEDVIARARGQAPKTTESIKATASNRVREEVDTRTTQAADQITPYAEVLHRAGHDLKITGTPGGSAAGRLAEQFDQFSDYLRQSDADRFFGDVEGFARKRPWAAAGMGVALGFMGARFLKASADTRYSATRHPLLEDTPSRDMPLSREPGQTVGEW